MALLHIYDADESVFVNAARDRRSEEAGIQDLAVSNNGANFISGLDGLVTARRTFNRILFTTHGCPGNIWFGNAHVDANWVLTNMVNRNYQSLCPVSTRVYFNGCNVAAEPGGRAFLAAMAQAFLRNAGGEVFAHTSLGFAFRWGSHSFHLWGDVVTLYIARGGRVTEAFTQ
jgi:hypothetical protein